MSTSAFATSPDCTSSTVSRPFSGPRSNRNGGWAVASANSWAAGSSTGLVVIATLLGVLLPVEELHDVVGEALRVLVEEAVVRIGVDAEFGVWEVLGE